MQGCVVISGQRFALASLINGWYGHSLRRRRWWGAGRFCKNRALDARGPWLHVVLRSLNLSLRSEVTSEVSLRSLWPKKSFKLLL